MIKSPRQTMTSFLFQAPLDALSEGAKEGTCSSEYSVDLPLLINKRLPKTILTLNERAMPFKCVLHPNVVKHLSIGRVSCEDGVQEAGFWVLGGCHVRVRGVGSNCTEHAHRVCQIQPLVRLPVPKVAEALTDLTAVLSRRRWGR